MSSSFVKAHSKILIGGKCEQLTRVAARRCDLEQPTHKVQAATAERGLFARYNILSVHGKPAAGVAAGERI